MKQIRLLYNVKFCGLANGDALTLAEKKNNLSEEINVLSFKSSKVIPL